MYTPEEIRKKIDLLITQKGLNYRVVSNALGRADSYIQQYITRGYPRVLKEKDRKIVAKLLEVDEQEIADVDLTPSIATIYRIGFVEAGAWTEAVQLPRDEWLPVNYPINDNLRKRNVFALGVRGNSMNKIFPPDRTTLICLDIRDYCDMVKEGIQNGDFVVAQRVSTDGKYEATVKRYTRIDEGTVVLEAMSNDPRYTNIIVGSENCEYQITAVVIDYQTKLKDL
ncbi:MAG: hypothetical protein KHX55_02360 [Proteobacteria bacterium]|nr:hypothetical protein [Pseudomonadota bacterium]